MARAPGIAGRVADGSELPRRPQALDPSDLIIFHAKGFADELDGRLAIKRATGEDIEGKAASQRPGVNGNVAGCDEAVSGDSTLVCLVLDSSRIEVMPLQGRSFQFKELAATGDSLAGQLVGEYTLEFKNENAHGIVSGLAV